MGGVERGLGVILCSGGFGVGAGGWIIEALSFRVLAFSTASAFLDTGPTSSRAVPGNWSILRSGGCRRSPSRPRIPRQSIYARPCGVWPRTARSVGVEGRYNCALYVSTHLGGCFLSRPGVRGDEVCSVGVAEGGGVDGPCGGPGHPSSRLAPPLRISPPRIG